MYWNQVKFYIQNNIDVGEDDISVSATELCR